MGFAVPRLTPVVKRIIIACVGIWLVQFVAARSGYYGLETIFGVVAVEGDHRLHLPAGHLHVLHSPDSIFHILFNMLVLWLFGSELESQWGSRAFFRYFLVCGVGGGLFIVALGLLTAPAAVTIGASGAIYGLITAFGMVFANRTVLFMMLFPMKARTFALVFFVIAFISTVDMRATGVSHRAHLGRAVTGFLYLKRAWRIMDFYRDLRWKMKRRKFKVMTPEDPDDRWLH